MAFAWQRAAMFFIARCIFWLLVVYANLPDGERSFAPDMAGFVEQAGRHAEAFAQGAAKDAADKAAQFCAKKPQTCLEAASNASRAAKGERSDVTGSVVPKRPG